MKLREIKEKLGHPRVHMLKMDIEGYEWNLLESEIIAESVKAHDLPEQLLFELHTENANKNFVPSALVKGKNRAKVNELMLELYSKGYVVMNLEMNKGDPACAEIALYRMSG
jgi:hypothetical protein